MKTLNLTTWERETLRAFMSIQRGDLAEIRRIFRVIDVLELGDQEKTEVGYKQSDNGSGPSWTNTDHVFSLDFEDADFNVLATAALASEEWLATRQILNMLTKLEQANSSKKEI